jgi:hypothetical protein
MKMATTSLSSHDISILSKIADPESSTSSPLLLDASLPDDPHHGSSDYQKVSKREVSIMTRIIKIEMQLASPTSLPSHTTQLLSEYQIAVRELDELISEYPKYASARNNRVQALRRLYGDGIFLHPSEISNHPRGSVEPLLSNTDLTTLRTISSTILTDLSISISLLTPPPFSPLSPKSAKTLSALCTQRGALYHYKSKLLSRHSSPVLLLSSEEQEGSWGASEFEEAAARDFMMGGRYGNEVAKALAVSLNPTAKLCGEMVRDTMRREFNGVVDE